VDPIVIFAATVLATVLDPIALIGFVVAGTLVRSYLAAMAVAIAWRVSAQLLFVMLLGDLGPPLPTAYSLFAMAIGAVIVTSIIFAFARHLGSRRKKSATSTENTATPIRPNTPADISKGQSFLQSQVATIRSWPICWRYLIAGSLSWAVAVLLYVWAFEPFDSYISAAEKWQVVKIVLVAPLAILATFGILWLFKGGRTKSE
jgi:hypothetical protein